MFASLSLVSASVSLYPSLFRFEIDTPCWCSAVSGMLFGFGWHGGGGGWLSVAPVSGSLCIAVVDARFWLFPAALIVVC